MKSRTKCVKAIGYARVSTGRQEISPEVQRERIEAYCKAVGLDLTELIIERGVSAKTRLSKRPAGSKIAALLKAGICHVVALKLDRLFRNAADALDTTDEWQREGISLHLVDMGGMSLNTGSSIGKMFLTMMAAFAEFERNLISERTTAALQHKRAKGQVYCGNLPYGFAACEGMLIPVPTEQAILVELRAMRAKGQSYGYIANELNANRVPSKTSGRWHPYTVQVVLREHKLGATHRVSFTQ
jgi:DNA invertase Pin-like site-specific DNA recombinase